MNATIKSIKTKAIIALVLSVLGFVPMVGVVFTIAFYAVMFFAVKGVRELSQSPTLLRNFAIFVGMMVLGVVLELIDSASNTASMFAFATTGDIGVGFGDVVLTIFEVAAAIAGIVFGYFYYREMSRLSDINLFFIAYIFVLIKAAAGVIPFLSWIAWLFALIAFIFELIAWIKLEHINKATISAS